MTAQSDTIPLCSNDVGNYTAGGTYRKNLNNIIHSLSDDDHATSGFYNLSMGRGPNRVNLIGLCRGDIGPNSCRDCINQCPRGILKACPNQKQAIVHCELCMVRYSNRSIYGVLDPDPVTFSMWNVANESNPAQFDIALGTVLTRLKTATSSTGGSVRKFSTGKESKGNVTVYGLLQCTPDLSQQLCDDCLDGVIGEAMYNRRGRIGGRVMKPNCNLRFEVYKFYEEETTKAPLPSPPPEAMTTPPPSESMATPPEATSSPPSESMATPPEATTSSPSESMATPPKATTSPETPPVVSSPSPSPESNELKTSV
ncbi:Cysteine-rich repeat secretory protein 38 [Linum perenne]